MKQKLILIDVDGTLVPFRPTGILFKRLFEENKAKYYFFGFLMLLQLRVFWWIPGVIKFQRRIMYTLLHRSSEEKLEKETEKLTEDIANHFKSNLKKKLEKIATENAPVYLLSHCPAPLADKIIKNLNFNGHYSIPLSNYFPFKEIPNFNKNDIINNLKNQHQDKEILFLSDDLVDIKALKAADKGILINASKLTKFYAKHFCKNIEIW